MFLRDLSREHAFWKIERTEMCGQVVAMICVEDDGIVSAPFRRKEFAAIGNLADGFARLTEILPPHNKATQLPASSSRTFVPR